MTTNEAASALRTAPSVIRSWIRQGRLQATKRGRDLEIDPQSVAEFLVP